jgi:hypothetical protein
MIHDEFNLPTSLGAIFIVPTGKAACRVHCDAGTGRTNPLLIRGVSVSLSAHLVHEKGEWRTEEGNRGPLPWNFRRCDAPPNVEPSVSAIRSARNAVLEAVTEFHRQRPDAFISAERARLMSNVEDCEADLERAQEVLDSEQAAFDGAKRKLDNFEAVYPSGEEPPAKAERFKLVRMLSSGLCNTPGMVSYAKNAFHSGDAAVAIKMMVDGYTLSRWEAIGILSGEIPTKNVGDVVEFHSPYREASE